jgi:DNA invertase Pin-like site-specific DNA recombinase
MGEDQINRLRRRLAKAEGRGRRGYGSELRAEVVGVGRRWRAQGGSRRELAKKLGLSLATLARWAHESDADGRVRAVDVIDIPEQVHSGLVVVLPSGVRIEGLTVAEAAELAQRLR